MQYPSGRQEPPRGRSAGRLGCFLMAFLLVLAIALLIGLTGDIGDIFEFFFGT